jgi:O-acetyl-ADP-ribose deacetylase (regulator of RNase III)
MPADAMDFPREKDYSVDLHVGDPELIRLVRGDITRHPADAIVNAANSELLPGGGVCGAIHRAGGPVIAGECARIRSERGPLSPGQAVATTAGRLDAKYVIHSVGPVWHGGDQGEPVALSSCYRESMRIADGLNLHSIAFPAISTGIFGYPVEQAAWVAIPSLIESLRSAKHLVFVSMVLFDRTTLHAFASAATSQRQPASGNPYKVAIGIMNE